MLPRLYLASTSPRRQELLKLLNVPFTVLVPEAEWVDETPLANEPPDRYVLRLAQAKAWAGWYHLQQVASGCRAAELGENAPGAAEHSGDATAALNRGGDTAALNRGGNLSAAPGGGTFRVSSATCSSDPSAAPSGSSHALSEAGRALVLGADTAVVIGETILGKPRDADAARSMLTQLSGTTHEVLTAVALTDGKRCLTALARSQVRFAPLPAAWIEAYVASGEPFDKAGGYAYQGAAAAFIPEVHGSTSAIVGLPLYETAQLLAQFGLGPHALGTPCSAANIGSLS